MIETQFVEAAATGLAAHEVVHVILTVHIKMFMLRVVLFDGDAVSDRLGTRLS